MTKERLKAKARTLPLLPGVYLMEDALLEIEESPIGPLAKEAVDEVQILYSMLRKQTPKTCRFFDHQIDPIKNEEALQRALNQLLAEEGEQT